MRVLRAERAARAEDMVVVVVDVNVEGVGRTSLRPGPSRASVGPIIAGSALLMDSRNCVITS